MYAFKYINIYILIIYVLGEVKIEVVLFTPYGTGYMIPLLFLTTTNPALPNRLSDTHEG